MGKEATPQIIEWHDETPDIPDNPKLTGFVENIRKGLDALRLRLEKDETQTQHIRTRKIDEVISSLADRRPEAVYYVYDRQRRLAVSSAYEIYVGAEVDDICDIYNHLFKYLTSEYAWDITQCRNARSSDNARSLAYVLNNRGKNLLAVATTGSGEEARKYIFPVPDWSVIFPRAWEKTERGDKPDATTVTCRYEEVITYALGGFFHILREARHEAVLQVIDEEISLDDTGRRIDGSGAQ